MNGFEFGKILLLPFTVLYGIAVSIRNMLYDAGLLRSTSFNIPVICVGNLSIGGAGKTPHVEYLIELLMPYLEVATLSRGYKRSTKGFRLINSFGNAATAGDEPLQYKRKYPQTAVAVSESRALGIPLLIKNHPELKTIILDDAFQHRSVDAGLNILLTDFRRPYTRDFLLPAGRLREGSAAADRANIIVVTKCPLDQDEIQQSSIISELGPQEHQNIFFSYYKYSTPYPLDKRDPDIRLSDFDSIILISAIASTDYLIEYLEGQNLEVKSLEYEDHHYFKERDIEILEKVYSNFDPAKKKVIVTTEKDASRLEMHRPLLEKLGIKIYVLPVRVGFHFNQGTEFDNLIKDFLLKFKV